MKLLKRRANFASKRLSVSSVSSASLSESRASAHEITHDSPPSKAESSHTTDPVVIADSVQTPLLETAPHASHNSVHDPPIAVSLRPVSIHRSQDPDSGRRLISFAFGLEDLLEAIATLKVEGENKENDICSDSFPLPRDVLGESESPSVLSSPALDPIEVEGTPPLLFLESKGVEEDSAKTESPHSQFPLRKSVEVESTPPPFSNPSLSAPFSTTSKDHSEREILAAAADTAPKLSLDSYGPPPGLGHRLNTGSAANRPAQDPKLEITHHEPHIETSVEPSRNHESSFPPTLKAFKDVDFKLVAICEETVHTPAGPKERLPGTGKGLMIGNGLLSPEATPNRKSCEKAKELPAVDSKADVETSTTVRPVPPSHVSPSELPKPMMEVTPSSKKPEDVHPPILQPGEEAIACGSSGVVFRRPSTTTPGRFRARKVIVLTHMPADCTIKATVREIRVLQRLRLKKDEARMNGEIVPGMEHVLGLGPEDEIKLHSNGILSITTDYYPADLSCYRGVISRNEEALLTVLSEMAQGLKYLHSLDIVHLDLKPENVLLTLNRHCVIGDYGGSQYAPGKIQRGQLGLPSYEVIVATHGFAAPEVSGNHIMRTLFDCRADVWSLGVSMYHLIAPQCLNLSHLDDGIPESFMDYRAMGLFRADIERNITRAGAPSSVISLVLKMCQMSAHTRPTADDILKDMKQPHPDSTDTSKPSPLLAYQVSSPMPPRKMPAFRVEARHALNVFWYSALNNPVTERPPPLDQYPITF